MRTLLIMLLVAFVFLAMPVSATKFQFELNVTTFGGFQFSENRTPMIADINFSEFTSNLPFNRSVRILTRCTNGRELPSEMIPLVQNSSGHIEVGRLMIIPNGTVDGGITYCIQYNDTATGVANYTTDLKVQSGAIENTYFNDSFTNGALTITQPLKTSDNANWAQSTGVDGLAGVGANILTATAGACVLSDNFTLIAMYNCSNGPQYIIHYYYAFSNYKQMQVHAVQTSGVTGIWTPNGSTTNLQLFYFNSTVSAQGETTLDLPRGIAGGSLTTSNVLAFYLWNNTNNESQVQIANGVLARTYAGSAQGGATDFWDNNSYVTRTWVTSDTDQGRADNATIHWEGLHNQPPIYKLQNVTTESVNIISPSNATIVFSNRTLQVSSNFAVDAWFYELNGEANVTFIPNTTFIAAPGSNTIIVFANNSLGDNFSDSVTFTMDNYRILSQDFDTTVLEGETTTYSLSIEYNVTSVTSFLGDLILNESINTGSSVVLNTTITNLTISLLVPSITGSTAQLEHFWNITINLANGSTEFAVSDRQNQTVNAFLILPCDAPTSTNVTTLNFSSFDEITLLNHTSDFFGSFVVSASVGAGQTSFNITSLGKNFHAICISPTDITLFVNAHIQYNASGASTFPIRNYFLVNAEINNVSTDINLFLINNDSATLVPLTVKTSSGAIVPNAIVKVQKSYLGENLFRLVAMGRTNEDGIANVQLQVPDPFYKFTVELENVVLTTTASQQITSTGQTITIGQSIPIVYQYFWDVAVNCVANATTLVISCAYTDTSGLSATYNLAVTTQLPLTLDQVCSITSSSATSTLFCDLSGEVNGTYYYSFTVLHDLPQTFASGALTIGQVLRFGETGILVALIMFLSMALVGIFKPEAVMVLGLVGLIMASVLELIPFQIVTIMSLVVAFIIFVYKGRNT